MAEINKENGYKKAYQGYFAPPYMLGGISNVGKIPVVNSDGYLELQTVSFSSGVPLSNFIEGDYITLDKDEVNNTLTINASMSSAGVSSLNDDFTGDVLIDGGNHITVTGDVSTNKITIIGDDVVTSLNDLINDVGILAGSNIHIATNETTNKITISANIGVSSVNEMLGDLTLVAGSNITITKNTADKSLTFSATGGGSSGVSSINGLTGTPVIEAATSNVTITEDTTKIGVTGGTSGVTSLDSMVGNLQIKSTDIDLLEVQDDVTNKWVKLVPKANQINFYDNTGNVYELEGYINVKPSTNITFTMSETQQGKDEVYISTDCSKVEGIEEFDVEDEPTPIKGIKIDNTKYEFANQVTPLITASTGTEIEGFQIKGTNFKFKQPDIPVSSSNSIEYYGANQTVSSSSAYQGSDIAMPFGLNSFPFELKMNMTGYNPFNYFNSDVYETNASQVSSYIKYTKVNNLKNPTWPAVKVEWEFNQTIKMGSFVPDTTKVFASLQKNTYASSTWQYMFQAHFGTAFGLTMNNYSDFLISGFEQTYGSLNCAGEPADNFKSNFGIVVTGNNTGTPEVGHQIFTPKVWTQSTNSTVFARIALDNNWPDSETWEPTDNMYFLSCKIVFTMEFIPSDVNAKFRMEHDEKIKTMYEKWAKGEQLPGSSEPGRVIDIEKEISDVKAKVKAKRLKIANETKK